jgi:hypothetical protein
MANEKVSQLTALTAAEIASEDIFLVGDVSARESKKMTSAELLLFVESSGSFNASSATNADTASYVLSSNVHGTVSSASYASTALSSSWAARSGNANTASIALTASYINNTSSLVASSSFLVYSANNGSASYAVNSNTSLNSSQSAFLVWSANNGSASFATRSFFATSASYSATSSISTTSSYASTSSFLVSSSYAKSSSVSDTASYALSFNSIVKGWAMVTWSYGATGTQPSLYMNNNISTVRYVSNFTDSTYAWYQYGIEFSNTLPSTDYIITGDSYSPYGNPERTSVIFHPVYSNRTTTSCTISIAINTNSTTAAAFFAGSSASYHNGENTYLAFQVYGN